jgi:hypothetical protein
MIRGARYVHLAGRPALDGMYSVDLLYRQPPALPTRTLLEALQARCPGLEPAGPDESPDMLAYVHTRHPVQYRGGRTPAQLLVIPGRRERDAVRIEDSIQQSWTQRNARELVAAAPHVVFVSDMMASGLPHKERLLLFLDALAAILDVVPCHAIHWRPSQQILTPDRFLDNRLGGKEHFLFAGPLNVRFFGDAPVEKLADTMGLAALGLPDLQCHFHGLDPDEVVRFLYALALSTFENGDVIESGHTVTGLHSGEQWTCRREDALVPPRRVVLDVDPGPLFAAGDRS